MFLALPLDLFAIISCGKHIITFVTALFHPIELNIFNRPSYVSFLFLNFLSDARYRSLLRRSSCTDVGRIPNFILILWACQFWKGEAGQKIISRTSHKSECGGSRCGWGGGCHWASPRPISLLFSREAISVVAITTIIHSYSCPRARGRIWAPILWQEEATTNLTMSFDISLFIEKIYLQEPGSTRTP